MGFNPFKTLALTVVFLWFGQLQINAQCAGGLVNVEIELNNQGPNGTAPSFVLLNEFGVTLGSGGVGISIFCIPEGAYTIIVQNMNCGSPNVLGLPSCDYALIKANGILITSALPSTSCTASTDCYQTVTKTFTIRYGCMNSYNCNYDPTATLDDGSCFGYLGCLDPLACNYEPWAECSSGNCCYENNCLEFTITALDGTPLTDATFSIDGPVSSYAIGGPDSPTWTDHACLVEGCYIFSANTVNNQPVSIVLGDLQGGNIGFVSEDGGSLFFSYGALNGCTDPQACNYLPEAICSNFQCTYPGCTNPQACNYSPNAGCDDGSCIMSSGAQVKFLGSACHITVSTLSNEILLDEDFTPGLLGPGNPLRTCLPFECLNVEVTGLDCYNLFGIFPTCESISILVNDNVIYTFVAGDGIPETQVICITQGCTDPTACNYDPGATTEDGSCSHVTGCTDPSRANYNPNALCDDGNCSDNVFGCTNPVACNYSPGALQDDGSCDTTVTAVSLHVVNNDVGAPTDITIDLFGAQGVLNSFVFPVESDSTQFFCLPVECINYQVSGKGATDIIELTTNATSFNLNQGAGSTCLSTGCSDPAFCNYSPFANVDDGSCCNNDFCMSLSMFDGGSETLNGAIYTIYHDSTVLETGQSTSVDEWFSHLCVVSGCYSLEIIPNGTGNPISWIIEGVGTSAQTGSGAGVFPFTVGGGNGCTDPSACNYVPTASCDDGSCYSGSPVRLNVTNSTSSPATINYSFSLEFNGPALVSGTVVAMAGVQGIDLCLPEDCFFFNISGMGSGDSWQLGVVQNGNVFVPFQGFTSSGSTNVSNFSICNLHGCADISACNFNGFASVDDGSCMYNCAICSTLELYDQGSETLNGTQVNVYDELMQPTQVHTSYQIDEDYIGICTEEFGCYHLEIIGSGTPGVPIAWSITINGNTFSGNGPGLYAISPSGTIGCTDEGASNYNVDASCDDGSCLYPGCTNPDACNFNAQANFDDGTCQFGIDLVLSFFNSAASNQVVEFGASNALGQTLIVQGLPVGSNVIQFCLPFECNTITFSGIGEGDSYSIFTAALGYPLLDGAFDGASLINIPVCLNGDGCTDSDACNFSPIAVNDDGSCSYLEAEVHIRADDLSTVQYGLFTASGDLLMYGEIASVQLYLDQTCLPEGCYDFVFYDGDESFSEEEFFKIYINGRRLFDQAVFNGGTYSFCVHLGCMDISSCNYDPDAFYDDGSCLEHAYGCADPLACNFDPGVYCHEYCVYNSNANLVIVNGSVANLINYSIQNEAGIVIYEGSTTSNVSIPMCLGPECYTVLVSGMQITSPIAVDFWQVEYNGGVVSSGNGQSPNHEFCIVDGCTNPSSCSYNPQATFDDGSCDDFMGISVIMNYTGNISGVTLGYFLEYTGNNAEGPSIESFSIPYDAPAGTYVNYYCVPVGCFLFIASGMEPGDEIIVTDFDGNVLLQFSGLEGFYSQGFCPGVGCTDPLACNYDILAVQDNGSCLYGTSGCRDVLACNYDALAVCDGGSCTYPGCMDVLACNYDPLAACDDGSCLLAATLHIFNVQNPVVSFTISDALFNLYFNGNSPPNTINSFFEGCLPEGCFSISVAGLSGTDKWELFIGSALVAEGNTNGVFNFCLHDGCTDLSACNFDPSAIHDDGSCFYGLGCVFPEACNFDPAAVCDDGSCHILHADFDHNLIVNTSDLLLFMANFGCLSACGEYDLDLNGVVNTSDLLLVMAEFGDACE